MKLLGITRIYYLDRLLDSSAYGFSISTKFLASLELVKELVRVSKVSRPSPGNLLKLYEDPSNLLARPTGKNSTVPVLLALPVAPALQVLGTKHQVLSTKC